MYPDPIPGVTATENVLSLLLDESQLDLDLVLSASDDCTDVKPLLEPTPVSKISKDELKYEPPTLEQPDATSNLELEKTVFADNIFSQLSDLENKLNSIEKRLHEYTGEVEHLEDCTGNIFLQQFEFFEFHLLTHFLRRVSLFLDSVKTSKASGFPIFSGGIEKDMK